jgi:hypothetical protein
VIMQVSIQLDERDIDRARRLTGIEDVQQLLPEVLRRFSQQEAAMRLIRMGGTMPDLQIPPRRRPEDPSSDTAG